jgi:N-acetylmuramoyl-L-alanine amidase
VKHFTPFFMPVTTAFYPLNQRKTGLFMSVLRRQTDIKELIIHCSATPNGRPHTADEIDVWHFKRNFRRDMSLFPKHRPDLKAIGYHNVIRTAGLAEDGRHILESGSHTRGHNMTGIGICLIGTDRFSLAQWQQLKILVQKYQTICPFIKILGHRDTSPDTDRDGIVEPHEWLKICPGFSVSDWLKGGMAPLTNHLLPGTQ